MKRSLPFLAISLLALLGPAAALAAPSPGPAVSRTFEIRGLAFGDLKIVALGKLGIDGEKLYASAGCNTIGGTVTVDGDVVTLVGPTFMTEMDCPGTAGDAEALLIKILQLGTFTITDGAWVADGGQIVTVEFTSVGPGPVGSPPDEPVTSSPAATIFAPGPNGSPAPSCPPVPSSGTNGTAVDGGPADGSGGGSSGSGSTGSGSSSSGGSTGPGDISSPPDPGTVPGSEPGATPGIDVPPPAPNPGGSPIVILPDPIGQDPNIGKPAGDPCGGFATGGVVEDGTGLPKAVDISAEHVARDTSGQAGSWIALPLGLLAIVVAAGFRRRSGAARVEATEADPTSR